MNTSPAKTSTESLTISDAIAYISKNARDLLPNKDADTVAIMRKVAEINESGILQNLDKKLTETQEKRLKRIISRLKNNEPLEHILRSCVFHGRHLHVSPDTLIPRVETEMLVDITVAYATEKQFSSTQSTGNSGALSIVDVGTGSGCVIISTALSLREPVTFYATDISPKALSIARKNIAAYKLGKEIKVFEGNLLDPISTGVQFDIIVANLPYVTPDEMKDLPESVRGYEPAIALDGGKNGTEIVENLLKQSVGRLSKKGVIILELQPNTIEKVKEIAHHYYPTAKTNILPDTFERNRFLVVET